MDTIIAPPATMTTEEFLAWEPGDGLLWQLENGKPEQMAPAAESDGIIQDELAHLLKVYLRAIGHPGVVTVTPGIVPPVLARRNVRIPDVAIAARRSAQAEPVLHEPIMVAEILSSSDERETWSNVYTYCSIPSVLDILILASENRRAEVLSRQADGSWPAEPIIVTEGDVCLPGIGFVTALSSFTSTLIFLCEPVQWPLNPNQVRQSFPLPLDCFAKGLAMTRVGAGHDRQSVDPAARSYNTFSGSELLVQRSDQTVHFI